MHQAVHVPFTTPAMPMRSIVDVAQIFRKSIAQEFQAALDKSTLVQEKPRFFRARRQIPPCRITPQGQLHKENIQRRENGKD